MIRMSLNDPQLIYANPQKEIWPVFVLDNQLNSVNDYLRSWSEALYIFHWKAVSKDGKGMKRNSIKLNDLVMAQRILVVK